MTLADLLTKLEATPEAEKRMTPERFGELFPTLRLDLEMRLEPSVKPERDPGSLLAAMAQAQAEKAVQEGKWKASAEGQASMDLVSAFDTRSTADTAEAAVFLCAMKTVRVIAKGHDYARSYASRADKDAAELIARLT